MKQILKFMLSGFLIAVGIAVATAIDRGCNIGEYAYGTMLSGFGSRVKASELLFVEGR